MRRGGFLITAVWVATVLGVGTLLIVVAALDLAPVFAILAFDMVTFSTMGLVIERQRPGNRIARVLVAAGALLVLAFSGFVVGATRYLTQGTDDVIGGFFAMVGGSTLGLALFMAVPMVALLFPDERLPGPRWRVPVALTLGALIASAVIFAVQPGPVNVGLAENPFGIDSELVVALGQLALPLETLGILAGAVLAVAAVATRFRRSTGLAGLVVTRQALLAPVTKENTLAVAASTLAAFALFQPLRRRVQRAVDRRFDRARYDGQRSVDAFAERLRNEVDLAGVERDFTATVAQALSPASSVTWIRRRPAVR